MNELRVSDYIEGAHRGKRYQLQTWSGLHEVTGYQMLGDEIWLTCGKANGGLGLSFLVTRNTMLTS